MKINLASIDIWNLNVKTGTATQEKNWVFATILNFLIPISLQPGGENLWYFKLRLFDLTESKVWNIQGLWH